MTARAETIQVKDGRTGVLLIHGLGGSPAELQFVGHGLTRAGLRVVCPNLPGHGGSDDELQATSWTDWYQSAATSLEELAKSCDTVLVGGLSTGAVLSLLLAADHPDKVQGIALYSPSLWLSGRHVPWYMPLFRLINFKPLANRFKFPLPDHVGIKDQRIRDLARSANGGVPLPVASPAGAVLERRRLAKVVMGRLQAIRQPALIVHAREDDYAGLDNAAYLQRQLSGRVDLTVLDDSYHMVTVDRQRDVVIERTLAFTGRVAAAVRDTRARANWAGRVEQLKLRSPAA